MTPWKAEIGSRPVVRVYERPQKAMMLYLRWWDGKKGNWRHHSLSRRLRTAGGPIIKDIEEWAMAQARAKYRELVADTPDRLPARPPRRVKVRSRTVTPAVTPHSVGLRPSGEPGA